MARARTARERGDDARGHAALHLGAQVADRARVGAQLVRPQVHHDRVPRDGPDEVGVRPLLAVGVGSRALVAEPQRLGRGTLDVERQHRERAVAVVGDPQGSVDRHDVARVGAAAGHAAQRFEPAVRREGEPAHGTVLGLRDRVQPGTGRVEREERRRRRDRDQCRLAQLTRRGIDLETPDPLAAPRVRPVRVRAEPQGPRGRGSHGRRRGRSHAQSLVAPGHASGAP
ncbi:hypothetical protein D3C74_368060 [compost metagenome]